MTDEEMAAFVGRYYARAVRREPDAEQMAFFRKTVQSGLRPAELMAAIDYAVSRATTGRTSRPRHGGSGAR